MKIVNNAVIKRCGECTKFRRCNLFRNPNYTGSMDEIHPNCPLQSCIKIDAKLGRASANRALAGWEHDYIIIVKKAKEVSE
jgi:hypothetical protein